MALECESARQASELRALQARAEQASTSHAYAWQAVSCLLAAWLDNRWHAIHHQSMSRTRPLHMHLVGCKQRKWIHAQVARNSHLVEEAEAERAELAHQAAELAAEQASLREQQQEAQREHERLAALADEIARQRAALDEQRSLIAEAQEKAKVSHQDASVCISAAALWSLTVSHSPADSRLQFLMPRDAHAAPWLMCAVGMLQAADKALAQSSEQRAELKEQAQQLRAAEQDLRQRQREAAERDAELKAFETNLTVSGSA